MDIYRAESRKALHGAYRRLAAHVAAGGGLGYFAGTSDKLYNHDSKFETKHKKVMSRINGTISGAGLGAMTGSLHGRAFLSKKLNKAQAEQSKRWSDDFKKRWSDHSWSEGASGGSARHAYAFRQKPLKDVIKEHTGEDIKSKADLKAWHRKKAKEHHPDRHMQAPEPVRKEHEAKFKSIQSAIEKIEGHPDFAKMAALKREGLYADPGYLKVQAKYNEGNLEDPREFKLYERALNRAIFKYHAKQGH